MATIYDTMRIQTLTQKWEQKKLNLTQNVKEDNRTPEQKQLDSMKEMLERDRETNQKNQVLGGIEAKIKSGGDLTPDEISYLKDNNPEMLREYEEVKAERESYKEKLKACKTKEDVARVKLNTLGSFMSQLKSIENDPYIPKGAKAGLIGKIQAKVNNIEQVQREFEDSQAYRDMPTEEEIREQSEQEKEAVRARYEDLSIDENDSTEAENDDESNVNTAEPVESNQKISAVEAKVDGVKDELGNEHKDIDYQDIKREINDFAKKNEQENHRFSVNA